MTKAETKTFERALLLAYGTDGIKWSKAEKSARLSVLRIINGRKSTRPVRPKRRKEIVYSSAFDR